MLSVLCKSTVCYKCRLNFFLATNINNKNAQFSVTSINCSYTKNRWSGRDYLLNCHLNKGLAFTQKERQALGIQGLLAPGFKTLEEQVAICRLALDRYENPLNKYLYLSELLETNVRLFYSLLNTDVEKFLPIIYTPTVGLACQKFGFIYRKPMGLYINIHEKGRILDLLRNWPTSQVQVIVVTDGERILGLGDLGAFGMGIPIGKLSLYTALAGVKPHKCLPVLLDVGCNNEFEDFATDNAVKFLSKYRDNYCMFNDDIQGTASIIVAGILAAAKSIKKKVSDIRYLFLGAGAAGVGIADLLVSIMMEENIPMKECQDKIFLFDIDGLLTNSRPGGVPNHAKQFGKDLEPTKDFARAVVDLKPTCLIGCSTIGGAFTPEILKQMAKNCERPLIFALSNPTSKAECTPQQAYDNTEGRCIFASGSPFPPVKYGGKEYHTGQGNNSYIFPGVGLGAVAAQISKISDAFFITAAKIVANNVTQEDINVGRVYPSLKRIQDVSFQVAVAVAEKAYTDNVARILPKPKNIEQLVKSNTYNLKYINYMPEFYDYPDMPYKSKF